MISILIATYGGAGWRRLARDRALPSAEGQGATEIILEHQKGGTVASSRNAAAERARGDWLLFLDADDELGRGYVAHMLRAARIANGVPTLLTPRVSYAAKGRRKPPRFWKEVDLAGGNWMVIGTVVPRTLFLEVGGFHDFPHGLEDWNLWARCVRAGAKIRKVPGAIYIAHYNERSKHHELARDREEYMKHYEAAKQDAWG